MKLLESKNFSKLLPMLDEVPFNTYFAQVVLQGHGGGSVWVDNLNKPGFVLVSHPYGMALMAGGSADDNVIE